MSDRICGEVKNLRASIKQQLHRLADKRSNPRELINIELARRLGQLAGQLGVQLGVLVGRDGRVSHLIVGTKQRIYLPDLGRYRLDRARLRRLRLVVFLPETKKLLKQVQRSSRGHGVSLIDAPQIPADLITDLEKLRLDALLVVAVGGDGACGPVAVAHLAPSNVHSSNYTKSIDRSEVNIVYESDLADIDLDFLALVDNLETQFGSAIERSFETATERAILVGAYTGTLREVNASMEELKELARTAGITVVDSITQRRKAIDPKTVIGKGKIEELVLHSLDLGANLLVFDRELSPGQLRSITNLTELRVIDRSMLILDIFAQRAQSSEGRLQVELAQLKYSLPRLTEKDTGLSRLTGGIGGRGPGETKLEIGRRRIRDRLAQLEAQIDKLANQRELRRSRRQERGVPVIAIVGYTNAGKSTLLNALTKSEVFVEDKLFATLDPSTRRMRFPNEKEVVFVDTVGFIRELPRELVAAFRATLEEVAEADFLLHVVDATNPELSSQIEVVTDTLDQLGIGKKPSLLVLNKADLLSPQEVQILVSSVGGLPVSALKRLNLDMLTQLLERAFVETVSANYPV